MNTNIGIECMRKYYLWGLITFRHSPFIAAPPLQRECSTYSLLMFVNTRHVENVFQLLEEALTSTTAHENLQSFSTNQCTNLGQIYEAVRINQLPVSALITQQPQKLVNIKHRFGILSIRGKIVMHV